VEENMPYLSTIIAVTTEFAVVGILVIRITWFHPIFFQISLDVLCAHVTIPEEARTKKLGMNFIIQCTGLVSSELELACIER
jgi:hypothetical protein